MAISTYGELKRKLITWSKRTDITDEIAEDCILLAEEKIDSARLRLVSEEDQQETALETNDRYLILPPRFQKMRELKIRSGGVLRDMTYRTPMRMNVRSGTGMPHNYTITNSIEFDIIPDQPYEVVMWFFRDLVPLDPTNEDSTNKILQKYPMIYLYGALEEVFVYFLDEARAARYANRFAMTVAMTNEKEDDARFAISASMTPPGATP